MQQFTLIQAIRHLFSLSDDKSEADAIDEEIRSNVTLRGTNLWVLIVAILIASVGLDVNSTAVVIGAMLISPLMGPIMGIGYGIGVYDFPLIRKSVVSWSVATLRSEEHTSELQSLTNLVCRLLLEIKKKITCGRYVHRT